MATKWFLFCGDAHSNEVVAQALNGLQSTPEFKEHLCADEKKRYLYEVPEYSFAKRLYDSQKSLKAKLAIYKSTDEAKPGEWKFPKRATTLDKLKKKSDEIKARQMKK